MGYRPWSRKEPDMTEQLTHTQDLLGFPGGASGKEPTCQCKRYKTRESERSPRREYGNPFQYSCLENLMDRGAWWATVHEVAKSQT